MQSKHHTVSVKYQIEFDQQYADYLSKIWTSINAIEKMKDELAKLVKLAQRGLKINELKTEKYTNKRANCENHWRDCKLLGSLWIQKITLKEEKYLQ